LIHTLTLRRNLISLAIFDMIFLKNLWWLTFLGHPVSTMQDRQTWNRDTESKHN